MSTIHEMANTIREIERTYPPGSLASLAPVSGVDFRTLAHRGAGQVTGYALLSGRVPRQTAVALIEVTEADARIGVYLERAVQVSGTLTARQIVRNLLNMFDYRSTVYDKIVRVHYREEFAAVQS